MKNEKSITAHDKKVIEALDCLVDGQEAKFSDNGSGRIIEYTATCKSEEDITTTTIKRNGSIICLIHYDHETGKTQKVFFDNKTEVQ